MRDRMLIYAALVVCAVIFSYPLWHGASAQGQGSGPEVRKPQGEKCVAPREVMRASHMDLLNKWRDAKVREGQRQYTGYDGKVYPISLTATCLTRCHGNKDEFCDRCHSYAGVPAPKCWGCHPSPAAPKQAAALAGGAR